MASGHRLNNNNDIDHVEAGSDEIAGFQRRETFNQVEIMFQTSITRRQACLAMLAGGTAGLLPKSLTAKSHESDFRLNYILGSSLYGTMPLSKILPEVRRCGAEHIDIWPRVHGNQREQIEQMGHEAFRKLMRSNHVELGMTSRFDLGPFNLEKEIPFVQQFGGRLIVTGAGSGEGKTLRGRVQSFLKRLGPTIVLAEEHGVTIAIENHGHSLIESPDSLRYLADLANSSHLGIALAPYHLPQDEKLLADLINALGPKIALFYAWQHGLGCMKKRPKEEEMKQLPGRGPLDFTPLLAALKKIQFSGWTEIFMHPVPRGVPILKTAKEVTAAVNESRRYLDRCLEAI